MSKTASENPNAAVEVQQRIDALTEQVVRLRGYL